MNALRDCQVDLFKDLFNTEYRGDATSFIAHMESIMNMDIKVINPDALPTMMAECIVAKSATPDNSAFFTSVTIEGATAHTARHDIVVTSGSAFAGLNAKVIACMINASDIDIMGPPGISPESMKRCVGSSRKCSPQALKAELEKRLAECANTACPVSLA